LLNKEEAMKWISFFTSFYCYSNEIRKQNNNLLYPYRWHDSWNLF